MTAVTALLLVVVVLQLGYLSGLPVPEDEDDDGRSSTDARSEKTEIENARTDKVVEARIVDIIADLEKSIRMQPRKLGTLHHEDDGTSRGEILLTHILDQVQRGHVSIESLLHWIGQLKQALSDHEISSDRMNSFLVTLKAKLAGTVYGDACCMFG